VRFQEARGRGLTPRRARAEAGPQPRGESRCPACAGHGLVLTRFGREVVRVVSRYASGGTPEPP
jgi:hypothetical protein